MNKIVGVAVFLEKRKARIPAGELRRAGQKFVFTYNELYFKAKQVIPLGPEFPLTQRQFESRSLFPTFEDRIPSNQNPAYEEYCQSTGINPAEKDPLILLSAIGKRGPSSFIFYPIFDRALSAEAAIIFRKRLGLTTREFAYIFEISQSALNALERKRAPGKDLLRRIEILVRFPEVARYFVTMNGGILMQKKLTYLESQLQSASAVEST